MRKTNVLNTKLTNAISQIEHTQWLSIGDAGLPIRDDGRKIDLVVVRGLPTFINVLEATLSEMKVQRFISHKPLEPKILTNYKRLKHY